MKRTVKDLVRLKGKVVLLRVDFNVPIDDRGRILDGTRINNALPTIEYLSKKGAKVVILSHLDRPKGYDIRKSLWPISLILMRKLSCSVSFCNSVVSDETRERIKHMKDGDVLLLENVRFYEGETTCDKEFSKELASLGDLYVDDAFGVAHRQNASNYGVARLLPNAIGLLMEKEIKVLSEAIKEPKRPFVVILGGAKVETKISILKKFVQKADSIIVGGAMAYTFLYAMGQNIGTSICHQESVEVAKEIIEEVKKTGKKLLLPVDHIVMRDTDRTKTPFYAKKMVGDMAGYDIGVETVSLFSEEIAKAGQIFWNGPMGMFEDDKFKSGTQAIANAVASSPAYTIAGGGDTVNAIHEFGLGKKINYLSTGGGATMKFLEKGTLPALEVIQEKIR